MMHPKTISIENFNYPLTEDRIAKYPLKKRDASKLLVYKDSSIKDVIYHQIPEYLPQNTHLIFNNTKVVQARLHFTNRNGRTIELFCLEPSTNEKDITIAMAQKGAVEWVCLVGGAKKWKEEFLTASIDHNNSPVELKVSKKNRSGANFTVKFEWDNLELSFSEILESIGKTPLPPYMKRDAEESDKNRYQTVFAEYDGSVAAPTSGLHFTEDLLNKIEKKGVSKSFVTLHVGAGTFKPVSADVLDEHDMHYEFIHVQKSFLENLVTQLDNPILPVGTTSMRTLESIYWLGLKCFHNPSISLEELKVHQWDPYNSQNLITPLDAVNALIDFLTHNNMPELITKTQLMIAPSYSFKIANGLITNFHQPKSTLLLLVSALIGDDWKNVYQHALDNQYRFLSYGDGCLLMP